MAQSYKKIDFEQIKSKIKTLDIKDLISKETNLSFAKNTLKQCPFCGSGTGKNHSSAFFAYPKTNTFNCFSCGAGGDFIKFIELYRNLDFTQTMRYIAKTYFYNTIDQPGETTPANTIKKHSKQTNNKEVEYKTDVEINHDFINYIDTNINELESRPLKKYLKSRCVSLSKDIHFLTNYQSVNNYLKTKYSPERLQKSGLFSDKGNLMFFGHRIIFTHRYKDKIIYIHARRTNKDNDKKYLYAKTKKIPFNLDALNNEYTTVRLVEGVFDAISLIQDDKPAISLGSNKTTLETIKYIAKKAKENNLNIKFIFDNDKPGKQAFETEKYKEFQQIFNSLDVLFSYENIKGAKDVNELYCIRNKEYIHEKMSIFFAVVAKKAAAKEFEKWFTIKTDFQLNIIKSCINENIYEYIGIELNKDYTKYRLINLKF